MKKLVMSIMLSLSSLALAEEPAAADAQSAEVKGAKELTTKYLTALKAKK